MSDQRETGIAWTDQTWNPVRGCSRISPGCVNCYAEKIAARFSGPGQAYEGLAHRIGDEARWTGKLMLVEEHLLDPVRWQRPRMVFVNSMSDLFHESLTDAQIDLVFASMALSERHTFQVLTKRSDRMRDYMVRHDGVRHIAAAKTMEGLPKGVKVQLKWPLPNVWLLVSVEDQKNADARIPDVLSTPAAVRGVSYEPGLGGIEFVRGDAHRTVRDWLRSRTVETQLSEHTTHGLNWIIVGGESGEGARPFNVEWARKTVSACKDARVAVFVKQLGAHVLNGLTPCGVLPPGWPDGVTFDADGRVYLRSKKGGDVLEWPEDLRVREYPAGVFDRQMQGEWK